MNVTAVGGPAQPPASASPPQQSLRERKKLHTRQALIDAALDLFERHGFDTTTVEQIPAAVGVSRRTFSRYFTAKEDVVVSVEQERYEEVVAGLAERPLGEPGDDSGATAGPETTPGRPCCARSPPCGWPPRSTRCPSAPA